MKDNPFGLSGKKILVTGASSGIGRQTAIDCARSGAILTISGRNRSRLEETLCELNGSVHKVVEADLTNSENLNNLVDEVDKLDGIVLCAGKGVTVPFLFATREKFDEVFDVNLFSQVELLRLLVKKKKLNAEASVVFVVSIGGTQVFEMGNSIYGASKAALDAMVRYCAKELAPKLIRVNGVYPGMVETPLIHDGTLTQEQLEKDKSLYPLKRYGTPSDISYGIQYLLSDAAKWMTGSGLVIDGGRSI